MVALSIQHHGQLLARTIPTMIHAYLHFRYLLLSRSAGFHHICEATRSAKRGRLADQRHRGFHPARNLQVISGGVQCLSRAVVDIARLSAGSYPRQALKWRKIIL